jgi:hypothetical protein
MDTNHQWSRPQNVAAQINITRIVIHSPEAEILTLAKMIIHSDDNPPYKRWVF